MQEVCPLDGPFLLLDYISILIYDYYLNKYIEGINMKLVSRICVIISIVLLAAASIIIILFWSYIGPFLLVYLSLVYLVVFVLLILVLIGKRYKTFFILLGALFVSPLLSVLFNSIYEEIRFEVYKDEMEIIAQRIIENNEEELLNSQEDTVTLIPLAENEQKYSRLDDVYCFYTKTNYVVAFLKMPGILEGTYYVYFINPPTDEDFDHSFFNYSGDYMYQIDENWYYYSN